MLAPVRGRQPCYAPGMTGYREHAPPDDLRDLVECLWTSTPRGAAHDVMPDGCLDVLVGFEGGSLVQAHVVGTMTRPLRVPPGARSFVAARLRPGAAGVLLGAPAADLTDGRADLTDVWRDAAPALEQLAGAATGDARLAALVQALRARARRAAPRPVEVVAAVDRITRAGGALSIGDLAPALNVTRQHLARAFARHVGVPPKTFARVLRVQRLLARAAGQRVVDWSALALDLGFYDASHLANEVRELTGRTPTGWLAEGA